MPLDAIKFTIQLSEEIPENWITADEANRIATSISNKNLTSFINKIMEVIKIAAEEGRTSCSVSKGCVNNEIIQRVMALLRSLGYEVANAPTALNINW